MSQCQGNDVLSVSKQLSDVPIRSPVWFFPIPLVLFLLASSNATARDTIVTREGDSAPGGGQISEVIGPVLFEFGSITYQAELIGAGIDGTNSGAIINFANDVHSELLRSGSSLGGGTESLTSFALKGLNTDGEIHFLSTLEQPGGDTVNALLRLEAGVAVEVARNGALPDSFTSQLFEVAESANIAGEVVFTADFSNGVVSELYVGNEADAHLLARQGLSVGGISAPVRAFIGSNNADFSAFSSTNEEGTIAFGVTTAGGMLREYFLAKPNGAGYDYERIFSLPNQVFGSSAPALNNLNQVVVQAYDPLSFNQNIQVHTPDGNAVISSFGDVTSAGLLTGFDRKVLLSDSQTVAFTAHLDFITDQVIYSTSIEPGNAMNGVLTEIARFGQLAPVGNTTFGELTLRTLTDDNLMLVGFESTLNPIGGGAEQRGYFVSDGIDTVRVVSTSDSSSAVAVNDFEVSPSAQISVSGQLAYRAVMGDGSSQVRLFTPNLRWRASGDGDWTSRQNWTLGLKPSTLHDVTIDTTLGVDVTLGNEEQARARSLKIGGTGNGNTDTLRLEALAGQAGPTLIVERDIELRDEGGIVGAGTLVGDITVRSGGFLNPAGGVLTIQGNLVHQGYLLVTGNGKLIVLDNLESEGAITVLSSGSVDVSGALSLKSGSSFSIGHAGLDPTFVAVHAEGGVNLDSGAQLSSTQNLVTLEGNVNNAGSISGSIVFMDDVVNSGAIGVDASESMTFQSDLDQSGALTVTAGGEVMVNGRFSGNGGFTGGGLLTLNGEVEPGPLRVENLFGGDLVLGASSSTTLEVSGIFGSTFDRFAVSGNTTLGGDLLIDLADGFQFALDQELTLIDVSGSLNGQFNGLGEGARLGETSGVEYFLTYQGGDGNDVVLYSTKTPDGPVWIGGTGDWHEPVNWSNGVIPGQADIALIDNGDGATSVISVDRNPIGNQIITDIGEIRLDADDELRITPQVRLVVHDGVVQNDGRIVMESSSPTSSGTSLQAPFGTSLSIQGEGEIQIQGTISAAGVSADLEIGVDQRITGFGTIRTNGGAIRNNAIIEANVPGGSLTIGAGATQFLNEGILRASSGGTMSLSSPAPIEGGTIEATGSGSRVTLFGNTLKSVTLRGIEGGLITTNGNPVFFENVSNSGVVSVQTVTASGGLTNSGRISFTNSSNPDLIITSDLTVTGGGALAYFPNGSSVSPMVTGAFVFSNVDNRVEGLGEIVVAAVTMGEEATLAPSQASVPVGAIFIDADTTFDGTNFEADLLGDNVNSVNPNFERVNVEQRTGPYTTEYDQVHVFGTLALNGTVEVAISLVDGYIPNEGDYFDILSADQILLNGLLDFDFPIVGGLTFEHEVLNLLDTGTIDAENPSGFNRDVLRITFGIEAALSPGDFDGDDDVDGTDFLVLQRGLSSTFDPDQLSDWQDNYGTTTNVLAASNGVPEPSSLLLITAMGIFMVVARRP